MLRTGLILGLAIVQPVVLVLNHPVGHDGVVVVMPGLEPQDWPLVGRSLSIGIARVVAPPASILTAAEILVGLPPVEPLPVILDQLGERATLDPGRVAIDRLIIGVSGGREGHHDHAVSIGVVVDVEPDAVAVDVGILAALRAEIGGAQTRSEVVDALHHIGHIGILRAVDGQVMPLNLEGLALHRRGRPGEARRGVGAPSLGRRSGEAGEASVQKPKAVGDGRIGPHRPSRRRMDLDFILGRHALPRIAVGPIDARVAGKHGRDEQPVGELIGKQMRGVEIGELVVADLRGGQQAAAVAITEIPLVANAGHDAAGDRFESRRSPVVIVVCDARGVRDPGDVHHFVEGMRRLGDGQRGYAEKSSQTQRKESAC